MLRSLQQFSDMEHMQKMALEVIAFATPPAKLEELRRLFSTVDADGNGTGEPEEFREAMKQFPEVPAQFCAQFGAIRRNSGNSARPFASRCRRTRSRRCSSPPT